MDLVLDIADEYFLDKVWAALVPVSAFIENVNRTLIDGPVATWNTSSHVVSSSSTWLDIVSHLPHPPIAANILSHSAANFPAISAWPRDYWPRQLLSLSVITLVGIHVMYFLFAYLSYRFIFNHEIMKHPRFLKDQVRLEIICSLKAFPAMAVLMLPFFMAEINGYSKMYKDVNDYGWGYLVFSIVL